LDQFFEFSLLAVVGKTTPSLVGYWLPRFGSFLAHIDLPGDNLGGRNSARRNVTWLKHNRISLHSTRSVDRRWVKMRQVNVVVSGPKFTKLCGRT